MSKIKIHVGTMPPPLGGISVYLYRLSKIKKDEIFINRRRLNKLSLIKLLCGRERHFFWNTFDVFDWSLLFFFSFIRGNEYTLVLHGQALEWCYKRAGYLKRKLLDFILNYAVSIQVVNPQIKEFMIVHFAIEAEKVFVQPAFLPPPAEDEEKILKTYPEDLMIFLDGHKPLIVANAFRIKFIDGIDLYGLDMCAKLIAQLKEKYPEIGLVFALADPENDGYLNQIVKKISMMGIKDNVYFLTGQKELWPIFKKVDLMVRPTCTDGDALSVREALSFGCPVVASDICNRPEATVLFASRNQGDYYQKVERELTKKNVISKR